MGYVAAVLAARIHRACAVLDVAEALADALDEHDAAASAWPTPPNPHVNPDLTQDEINAIGLRQRAADAGVRAAIAAFREAVRS